ncbi:hypothetical protein LAUMK22_03294 [Mycobacterium kansasii]|nr:hypothetical protein LAUMK22_03294 [Mycobacterium kansasii]
MTGIGRFDGDHLQPVGHPGKGLPQCVCGGDVDAMRTHPVRCGDQIAERTTGYPARHGRRRDHGVDHDGQAGARPRLDQTHGLDNVGHHPDIGQAEFVERGGGDNAHAVIATVAIAQPDDDNRARGHSRCTVSVRKCAEHEMHGS